MIHLWNWLLYILGANSSSTRWYYFWSAFGSGPLAWCVLPLVYWRHHICHENHCYRLGHPVGGGVIKCRKHLSRKGIKHDHDQCAGQGPLQLESGRPVDRL